MDSTRRNIKRPGAKNVITSDTDNGTTMMTFRSEEYGLSKVQNQGRRCELLFAINRLVFVKKCNYFPLTTPDAWCRVAVCLAHRNDQRPLQSKHTAQEGTFYTPAMLMPKLGAFWGGALRQLARALCTIHLNSVFILLFNQYSTVRSNYFPQLDIDSVIYPLTGLNF